MRNRVFHRAALLGLFLQAVWFLAPHASCQQSEVSLITPITLEPDGLDGLIDKGLNLEKQRRWGEALTLYEDGLRQFPSDSQIERRLEISRTFYDLNRRYHDGSFREGLKSLSPSATEEIYGEVLLKIQAHYVSTPNWGQLVRNGARAFELALNDPLFVETHLQDIPSAKISSFRKKLRAELENASIESRKAAMDKVSQMSRLADRELGIKRNACVLEMLCGAMNSLDPYSSYLTGDQLDEVYSQIDGSFVGLGVELRAENSELVIMKVIPGSPANEAGILEGDRIVEVDGIPTSKMSADEATNSLQGPEGSKVKIAVISGDHAARKLTIQREHVEVPSIDKESMLAPAQGIAYVRLTCFQKTTSKDLDLSLRRLHKQGMRCLIIDLRGNPGGLLTTSVEVADRFLEKGLIVSTRGRSPNEDYNYSAHAPGTWRVPLVVLIDGDSASASEIFAGAIHDHHRGSIVGERSYGKGSVQGIFPLNQFNAGLRLTTAKFYSPSGKQISHHGVDPDVKVQTVARPISDGTVPETSADNAEDTALDTALDVARRKIAKR